LSAQDVELASICDSLARDFGEVVEEKKQEGRGDSSGNSEEATMRHLADTVSTNAGDCCTPKKKSGDGN
jgi:4a-hydroxytetrahydrobiopterin dehydratase